MSESITADVLLAQRTWQEAQALAEEDRLVIVPVGSTEAHGPHMPLDTDTHQADTVARLLADRVGAVVAPALPYGYAEMWMGFPGPSRSRSRRSRRCSPRSAAVSSEGASGG